MTEPATTLLSNALLVVPLALLVAIVTRFVRHPAFAWALWGLVLLKFVTPAVWTLPVDVPAASEVIQTLPATQPTRPGFVSSGLSASDAAMSNAQRPASVIAEPQVPDVARDANATEARAPLTAAPLSIPSFEPADAAAPTDRETIVPAVVSTTILTEDDFDARPTTGFADARTDRATVAPAPAVAPVETIAETETTAVLGITQLGSRIPRHAFLWLWAAWIAGSVIAGSVAVLRVVRFRRLLSRAAPADEQTLSDARALADQLGVRRLPEIRLVEGRLPPLLYGGVRRAVILLPRKLLDTLDAESRRTLLAHELAHVVRRDHWTRWLELLVRCLYWWHPLAWYAGRRLRDAEEQCCDARVVSLLPNSAAAYARTILTTVDYLAGHSQPVPTLATGLQPLRRSIRPLHRRLTMIVEHKPTARMSWPCRLILLALAACVLPLSLMAQPQPEQTPTGPAPLTIDIPFLAGDLSSVDSRLFSFYVGVDDPSRAKREESSAESNADDNGQYDLAAPTAPAPDATLVTDAEKGAQQQPDEQQPSTITVQRKSYAIDGTVGEAVVRLLEQMQRSGLVDPLLAHLNGGNGADWDGKQWNYQTSVTVITWPAAHEAIGAFINGLRELRPAPGQSGPEELQIRKVVYDRLTNWDTSRQLAGLLGEALKMGHIGYLSIGTDKDHRMTITTTDPVHKLLGPLVDFLNEQQAERGAAVTSATVDPFSAMRNPSSSPLSAAGSPPANPLIVDEQQNVISGFPLTPAAGFQPAGRGGAPTSNPFDDGREVSDLDVTGMNSGLTAPAPWSASPKRPQVLTGPQEVEEMHLLAKVYGLHPAIVQPLGEFLQEVRDGFPFYSSRLARQGAGGGMDAMSGIPGSGGYDEMMMEDSFGTGIGAGDLGKMMSGVGQRNVATRIFAPAEAQKVLGQLVAALHATLREQSEQKKPDDAETIVLVRGEYDLSLAAAEKFEILLRTCEQHGLATPVMVTRNQTRVKVIAEKDLQSAIREFIAYLSENWKTAALSPDEALQPLKRLAGIELAPLNAAEMEQHGRPFHGGLKVTAVDDSAPLMAPGIREGDVLFGLGDERISSLHQVRSYVQKLGTGVSLKYFVQRDGEVMMGMITPKRRDVPEPLDPQPIVPGVGSLPAASPQVQKLDLKIAEIELESAQAALEATKRFIEKGFKTQADLKAAELEVLKAQHELERLQRSLSNPTSTPTGSSGQPAAAQPAAK